MQENDTVSKQPSLKVVLQTMNEIDEILSNAQHKLNHVANNTPIDSKEMETKVDDYPTLDSLNAMANTIRRKANDISAYTNKIVGN